ncbi:MAG: lipoyl(octanoyl) transferase LipB [Chloroflexi bacterium]|nr:lipoyl(octanoyl) transferase LipB [Chloroflexota bacterium]
MTDSCRFAFLGLVEYRQAWALQRAVAQAVAEGAAGDTLLLLEHPPTYTLGRRSRPGDLLTPREVLEAMGAEVLEVDRGGEITFHGPGQLVGYPIVRLGTGRGPLGYVRALEAALTGALANYGLAAGRVQGLTGVWVGDAKIAAIGVKISRGVTMHGFALNVSTDLAWFQHIVPCGIRDKGVTSMEWLLGRPVPLVTVASQVAERLGRELGLEMQATAPESLAPFLPGNGGRTASS